MTNRFYSYDPDDGFEEYSTLESAKKSAEMSLEHWREQAGGEGWHERIEHLEYGILIPVGTVHEVDRKETLESNQFDYTCDYELTAPMPERKLPVVYAVFDSEDALDGLFANLRLVEYIPRAQANEVVRCWECEHFLNPNPIGEVECNSVKGLPRPRKDGSDWCSYAERKARGE